MPPEIREALVTAGVCTGIVYVAFLLGWLFRDRLGVPKGNLRSWWVLLLVMPLLFVGLLVLRAALPSWARGILIGVLALALLWGEGRFYKAVGKGQRAVGGRGAAMGDQ